MKSQKIACLAKENLSWRFRPDQCSSEIEEHTANNHGDGKGGRYLNLFENWRKLAILMKGDIKIVDMGRHNHHQSPEQEQSAHEPISALS
jgi:hypothetical protein